MKNASVSSRHLTVSKTNVYSTEVPKLVYKCECLYKMRILAEVAPKPFVNIPEEDSGQSCHKHFSKLEGEELIVWHLTWDGVSNVM